MYLNKADFVNINYIWIKLYIIMEGHEKLKIVSMNTNWNCYNYSYFFT